MTTATATQRTTRQYASDSMTVIDRPRTSLGSMYQRAIARTMGTTPGTPEREQALKLQNSIYKAYQLSEEWRLDHQL